MNEGACGQWGSESIPLVINESVSDQWWSEGGQGVVSEAFYSNITTAVVRI